MYDLGIMTRLNASIARVPSEKVIMMMAKRKS